MNIVEILRRHAVVRGNDVAIVDRRGPLTFRELDEASARVAARLEQLGLGAGDPALILCPMSSDLYVTLIGLFRLGAMAMFVDPSAGRPHLERCCRLMAPKMFLGSAKAHLLRIVSPAIRRIPRHVVIGSRLPIPGTSSVTSRITGPARAEVAAVHEQTPALVTFTSGSTGEPKAAVRTHGFLLAQHAVLEDSLSLAPGDVDLTTLPIFVLANLASGVTSVIPDADLRYPGRIEPGPVFEQLQQLDRRHRLVASRIAASPALLARLAAHAGGGNSETMTPLAAFTRIFTGGAPVFPSLLARLHAAAPGAEVTAVYGSTEAEPIAHVTWQEITEADRHAMRTGAGLLTGHPVASIQLRILPDRWGQPIAPLTSSELDALALPPGEHGEIVVSGPHVLTGYLHGQGDEETKFDVDGRRWHRTGDAGYLDDGGRLWLLGRCSARIDDDRGRAYPFAVECALDGIAGVRRTAFLAHNGRRLLVAELEPGASPQTRDVLRAASAWAHPDDVRVIGRLPVDARHNAKIDYPALRKLLD
jgi:acyl-CoA synthetase (AMP-forming)/AMP-acid ligase II